MKTESLLFLAIFTFCIMERKVIFMKRYFVLMNGEKNGFIMRTNSLKIARWFADLKFWTYSKIHDTKAPGVDAPWSKCIYINDRRGS